MLIDFLRHLNWVDICLACLFARVVFVGLKSGFVIEFFKLGGVFCSVFITFHYYSILSNLLIPQLSIFEPTAVRVFVFLFLWFLVTLIFKLVREGTMALFSVEPHPVIKKWGGCVLAVMRGLTVCSLTFFALLLSLNPGIIKLSEKSASRFVVAYLAPHIYSGIYDGLVVKFFPSEPINNEAFSVMSLIEKKKI